MSYEFQIVVATNAAGTERCFAWFAPVNETISDWLRRWKRHHPGWQSQEVLPVVNFDHFPDRLDWMGYGNSYQELFGLAA